MSDSINLEFSSRIVEKNCDFLLSNNQSASESFSKCMDSNKPEANINGDAMKAYRDEKNENIVEIPKQDSDDVEYFPDDFSQLPGSHQIGKKIKRRKALDDFSQLPGSHQIGLKIKKRKALGLDPDISMEETKYFISYFEKFRIFELIKLNNIGDLLLDDSMFSLDNIEQMTHFSGWWRYFRNFLGIMLINSVFSGIPLLIWSVSAIFDPQKQKIISYVMKIFENPNRKFREKEKTNEINFFRKPHSVYVGLLKSYSWSFLG